MCSCNEAKAYIGEWNTQSTGLGRAEFNTLSKDVPEVGEVRKKISILEKELSGLESAYAALMSKLTPILPPPTPAVELKGIATSPAVSEIGISLQALIDRIGELRYYIQNLTRDVTL